MNQYRVARLFGIAFCTLALFLVFTRLFSGLFEANGVSIMRVAVFGGVFMLLAIPAHICGRFFLPLYGLSIVLNMLGTAFYVALYYTYAEMRPGFDTLFFSLLLPLLYLAVLFLLVGMAPERSRALCAAGTLVSLFFEILYLFGWIIFRNVFFSFGFFSLIIAFTMTLALRYTMKKDKPWTIRYASFAGFGYFSLIAIIVLAILTDGDILADLDFDFGPFRKKKK